MLVDEMEKTRKTQEFNTEKVYRKYRNNTGI
jgi:hypothetical protein